MVILHLLGIIHIYAQQSVSKNAIEQLESFVVNMNNFNRQYPQEKVYLHLDNTGYFMGETIWFKAYVVRADKTKLTDISGVLYVELVDPTGEIIRTEKVKITNGTGSGYMILTDFLNSGFYEIRAYTRYMTNWDSGGIFSRVIPILNAPKKKGDYTDRTMDMFSYEKRLPNSRDEQVVEQEKKMNVTFYPEGGHLVQGVENRVAFSITDEDGAGSVSSLHYTEQSIKDTVAEVVDESRVINGIPFYTTAWIETPVDVSDGSGTYVADSVNGDYYLTSQDISMDTAKELYQKAGATPVFDENTGQNQVSYQDGKKFVIIWLEDETSVKSRLELMKKYSLGGSAYWCLGQESSEIWNVIQEYFK